MPCIILEESISRHTTGHSKGRQITAKTTGVKIKRDVMMAHRRFI